MSNAMPNYPNRGQFGPEGLPGPEAPGRHPGQAFPKLTNEDKRILKECNREAFWYRAIPYGVMTGGSAVMLVKMGKLSPNPKYGAIPKALVFGICGYMFGKVSYQPICMEKVMNQSNSPLAAYLRQQRQRGGAGAGYFTPLPSESDSFYNPSAPLFGGSAPASASNSDVMDTRNDTQFHDNESATFYSSWGNEGESKPAPVDEQMLNDDNLPPPAKPNYTTSYDDLRRQNRVEYEMNRHGPLSSGPDYEASRRPGSSIPAFGSPPPSQLPPSSGYSASQYPQSGGPSYGSPQPSYSAPAGAGRNKNMYGDVWEETK